MDKLRTPDERFENLPDFPFAPHYVDVDDTEGGSLRVHYLDEGPRDGDVVLCLHGEPSWSYLYRKMIPIFTDAGLRTVAVDLPGFGRSDKPTKRTDYTYQRYVEWTWSVVDQLGLSGITLFCQDWGGLIGLRLVGEHPDRFARVVASNTFLPKKAVEGEGFLQWQALSQKIDPFDVGRVIDGGTVGEVSDDVKAAYDAPFPDETYKTAAKHFPMLVPTSDDDPALEKNVAAWRTLEAWDKPFLTLFGDSDPVTGGMDTYLQNKIPGARGQPHTIVEGAGHFSQEDKGEELARHVVDFVRAG